MQSLNGFAGENPARALASNGPRSCKGERHNEYIVFKVSLAGNAAVSWAADIQRPRAARIQNE